MLQFDLDIGDQDTSGKTLPHLREMTFNLTTGEASSRQVADTICDFPRVPLDLVGESAAFLSRFSLSIRARDSTDNDKRAQLQASS